MVSNNTINEYTPENPLFEINIIIITIKLVIKTNRRVRFDIIAIVMTYSTNILHNRNISFQSTEVDHIN